VSASGSKADSGHWCSSCSKLLHLGVSAEPGEEAVFKVTRYSEGHCDEVRLALIDYEPSTGEVTLSAKPLGSKYARYRDDENPVEDPDLARQAKFVASHPDLFRPVTATTRLTVGDDVGHVKLDVPVGAYRFAWTNHRKVAEGANGKEVYVHLESGRVLHRSREVTVLDDVPVSPETSLFKALNGTFTLIPAFRVYPLPTDDSILNTVLDHVGRPMHALLRDYVHRDGGWDPSFMSDATFADVLRFAHAFTI
jgi:hypothetical protein